MELALELARSTLVCTFSFSLWRTSAIIRTHLRTHHSYTQSLGCFSRQCGRMLLPIPSIYTTGWLLCISLFFSFTPLFHNSATIHSEISFSLWLAQHKPNWLCSTVRRFYSPTETAKFFAKWNIPFSAWKNDGDDDDDVAILHKMCVRVFFFLVVVRDQRCTGNIICEMAKQTLKPIRYNRSRERMNKLSKKNWYQSHQP